MKKLFSKVAIGVFASILALNASAQNIEQLVCRDQSIYEGYIVEQKAGRSMSVLAEKATIVVRKSSMTGISSREFEVDKLSHPWHSWVTENLPEGTRSITLKSFSSEGVTYNDVYVLEDGSYVTFIDLSKRKYTIPWNNVLSTTKTIRPENELSGVNDIVVTKFGDRYVGQITEQSIGQYVKIRTIDGKTASLSLTDLVSTSVEPINDNMPLFSQVRLLDIIEIDGQKIEGVIVNREFGKQLCLQLKDGRVREYPITKVTTYAKKINPDYVSVKDRLMTAGEIYLDGEAPQMDSLKVQDIGFILQDTTCVVKKRSQKVMLELKMEDVFHPIAATKTISMDVYKLNKDGRQDRSLGRERIIVAQYCDLVQSPIKCKRSISPLGNINIEYVFDESGIYVIYIKGFEKGIIIKVE